ncbi:fimbrial protein [Stenotrophomonas sp. ZAC14A_NAIMI4_1]|uniref:fimbrial protein n=1 Tax=Stenotrophomonas sp. ZAC14A_NAIMI4_1 TaxID=2072412 RepID=UPI000D5400DB|nr:fimbrial protein [Stenotrophomonas sp. ZAC14A_NAIMI4_1]AWH45085.1 fimbrial protein [Stenotrophomonas sp. ZAC14A_NAIMI4_1]
MKTQHSVLAMLMLATMGQARADSATIDVIGKVLPGTCTMANVPVALDEIDAVDLGTGGEHGLKPAVLNFTGCLGVTSVELTFDGTADATQDGHWQNLSTGGATGVAVALLDGTTGNVFLKKGATKAVTINGAAAGRLDMRTGYYRKAGTLLKAGDVSTQITVTADYK